MNNFSSNTDFNTDFSPNTETAEVEGILEILPDYGFLRRGGYTASAEDIYISLSQIHRFELRAGDLVFGIARPPKEGEKYWGLLRIDKVNGQDPEKSKSRPIFEELTPIFPQPRIVLETKKDILTTRLIDLVAPIGWGQRGLIVSPPYAGKTWLLRDIANGLTSNHKDLDLVVLLIGERPEEVTDMKRSVNGEVIASNFDESPEDQIRVADLALDKVKRKVEMGANIVMLVDSITRLARAHNLCAPPSGRTLSGGFDPVALFPPKRFFGAARKLEDDGSLTIIATALVETGSRMDDLIYEEFKGTGNMELFLDRSLAERRVFPAIDVTRSYTRREDLLFTKKELEQVYKMRKMLDMLGTNMSYERKALEVTQLLLDRLRRTENNKEFLETLHEEK